MLWVSVVFGLVLLRQLATANENLRLAEQLRVELAERKAAEELLYLNQERMKYLLSATPAVIYTADTAEPDSRRLAFISDNVRDVLGHAPDALTTDRRLWQACVHSEDRPELYRVKNNLQIVSSLLSLQAERVQDPKTAAMLRDSQNRVRSMAYIHEQLYRSSDLARVNFADYARALASHLLNSCQSADVGDISPRVDVADDARLSVYTAILCGLIVNELVSNALKHAFLPG